MPAYYNETANACAPGPLHGALPPRSSTGTKSTRCGIWATARSGPPVWPWPCRVSSISNVDVGSATLKLSEDGTYNLIIGAADMGTGCDTILAQMAAECMDCSVDDIAVFGADTDASPYDSGSYASSTTYIITAKPWRRPAAS